MDLKFAGRGKKKRKKVVFPLFLHLFTQTVKSPVHLDDSEMEKNI